VIRGLGPLCHPLVTLLARPLELSVQRYFGSSSQLGLLFLPTDGNEVPSQQPLLGDAPLGYGPEPGYGRHPGLSLLGQKRETDAQIREVFAR